MKEKVALTSCPVHNFEAQLSGRGWQSQRPYQVEDVTRSFMAVAWLIETIVALPMAPGGASRGCLDSIRAEDGQGLGTLIDVIELSVKILTKQRGSDWA